ncbi:MAG: bifunctional phosphoglucose/phosphomannose isomerase [Chloroflexi bacterium]|nr:bifunctional phosphoglucose/phosphomannose isomerase [Chloroflexota bacterium]
MNPDALLTIKQLDSQNMLGEIDNLPAQLEKAWKLGQTQPLPEITGIQQAIISGMGGSAIGADLLAAYIALSCPVPVIVQRDYGLPAWAHGSETLVIASSHSGNTEETLEAFNAALQNKCRLMAIATGGKLAERAGQAKIPLWKFDHTGQPRAAVGFSFGLLLAIFARLGLIPDPVKVTTEVVTTIAAMKKQQETLGAAVPVTRNPAKRLAGQLVGRWVNVYASGCLAPVARRWKTQFNEIAKAGAGFEVLPEADHNALAGLLNPADILFRTMTLFLRAPSDHPRNQLRADLTRQGFMVEGMNTEVYDAQGDSSLAHIWTTLHFGDYTAYYLAMAYGVDPTPVEALVNIKASMKAAR